MRYIRAFFTALRMTLRGEQPISNPYLNLSEWMSKAVALVDSVIKTMNVRNAAVLKTTKVRLDGRDTSVEVVLATIKHHMTEEYPYLLQHETRNSINTIHASNVNDVYHVSALLNASALQDAAVQQVLMALKAHLDAIPPQNNQ
jgi:hypothetical protein